MEPESRRRDLEKVALAGFSEIASRYPFPTFRGQGLMNRIARRGNSYFQFGDLRVDTPRGHIIIEAESAGGVTNLVKYWYCIESGEIVRPLTLLHVFAQVSADDYASHLLLWDHLAERMRASLGDRFAATRYTYRTPGDLDPIRHQFELLLSASRG